MERVGDNERLIEGASAKTTVEDHRLSDGDQLPMVVWLSGQETYYEEFILDAETVMEQLGIKRSRLTQISGRELRVGRARRGRHIVPLFRRTDVNTYQEWVRAPATHQRSSAVVHEAVEELRRNGARLTSVLEGTGSEVASSVERRVRAALAESQRAWRESLAQVLDAGEELGQELARYRHHLELTLSRSVDRDLSRDQLVAETSAALALLTQDVARVRVIQGQCLTAMASELSTILKTQEESQSVINNLVAEVERLGASSVRIRKARHDVARGARLSRGRPGTAAAWPKRRRVTRRPF